MLPTNHLKISNFDHCMCKYNIENNSKTVIATN